MPSQTTLQKIKEIHTADKGVIFTPSKIILQSNNKYGSVGNLQYSVMSRKKLDHWWKGGWVCEQAQHLSGHLLMLQTNPAGIPGIFCVSPKVPGLIKAAKHSSGVWFNSRDWKLPGVNTAALQPGCPGHWEYFISKHFTGSSCFCQHKETLVLFFFTLLHCQTFFSSRKFRW